MPSANSGKILVCIHEPANLAEVKSILTHHGYELTIHLTKTPKLPDLSLFILILIAADADHDPVSLCRRIQDQLQDNYVPVIVLANEENLGNRQSFLDSGVDVVVDSSWTGDDLVAQCRALGRIKETIDQKILETREFHRINQRLQQAYLQIDQELDLARTINTLDGSRKWPRIPGFSVSARRCGKGMVGGDFVDIFQIDEQTYGFCLGDAMGHSVHSQLLADYSQKFIQLHCWQDDPGSILTPEAVLSRLNLDLLLQNLPEGSFLSLLYGLIQPGKGQIRLARAGQPHPILIPTSGPIEQLKWEGFFLGIAETSYLGQDLTLGHGDKLLLFSDGIESASTNPNPTAIERLMEIVERHRSLPLQQFLAMVTQELGGNLRDSTEEITFLGLEFQGIS